MHRKFAHIIIFVLWPMTETLLTTVIAKLFLEVRPT